MSLINVSFDPDDCMFATDIAREVGVTSWSAQRWIARHLDELPQPVFALLMAGNQRLLVWTRPNAVQVIEQYRAEREVNGRG